MIPFVREAYDAEKWAFVTDYARLWIVYNHGGIYLDTDVELIRPLDSLLSEEAYFGLEDDAYIATGLGFGAQRGNDVIRCMMSDYESSHFKNAQGEFDMTPCPVRNTRAIKSLASVASDGTKPFKLQNATVYPREYFCPMSPDLKSIVYTENTYSVHRYCASWLSEDEKTVHEWRVFKAKCERIFGFRIGTLLARAVYLSRPRKREILKRM